MTGRSSQTINYILGIVAVLLLTVVLIRWVMDPPTGDLYYLALYLSITSLGSAVFGFVSNRLGWWRRLPRLSYALILGYILAGGLTIQNVSEAIERVRPYGVDIISGVEKAPGVKDEERVCRFVQAAKQIRME